MQTMCCNHRSKVIQPGGGDEPDGRFLNVRAAIVKVTNRCNLDCRYCYENIVNPGHDMEVEGFLVFANRVLRSTKHRHVHFIFHGGEPTIMPTQWFTSAVLETKTAAAAVSKRVTFSIQTNLISAKDDKLKVFRELGINLSVSLDGPGSFGQLRQGAKLAIKNFKRARDLGLNPSVLMTINSSNCGYFEEILGWLKTELCVRSFKANIAASVGTGVVLPPLSCDQIFRAQRAIIDHMLENKIAGVIEHNIAFEIAKLCLAAGDLPHDTLCDGLTCGAASQVVGVSPDGNLLPCGRFAWNDKEYFLGSVNDAPSKTNTTRFRSCGSRFQKLNPENWIDCSRCDAARICSFGCKAFIARSQTKRNIECAPTKLRHHYYRERINELKKLALALSQEGYFRWDSAEPQSNSYNDTYNDFYRDVYRDFYRDYSDYYDWNLP